MNLLLKIGAIYLCNLRQSIYINYEQIDNYKQQKYYRYYNRNKFNI